MEKRAKFRNRLKEPGIIVAPGAYDSFSAKLIESAGFEAVYMTGFGSSVSLIAKPDVGLLTMTEMVTHARNINQAVKIPLIADADTGFGGTANVIRTVREYEGTGAVAIHIEDQAFPKRCGALPGKDLISVRDYINRLEAALKARQDPDFMIIARTDAVGVAGIEEAIRRAKAYEEAGADGIFVNTPGSLENLKRIAEALKKPILHSNIVENVRKPYLSVKDFMALNCKILILPLTLLFVAAKAMQEFLGHYKEKGNTEDYALRAITHAQCNQIVGIEEFMGLDEKKD
jgi:2,3-dimethylmalate lyase